MSFSPRLVITCLQVKMIIITIIITIKMKIPELSRGDETVAVLVEDAERLPDFLLAALITIKKKKTN